MLQCKVGGQIIQYWLHRQGLYKQFVASSVSKILEKEYIKWYYDQTKP